MPEDVLLTCQSADFALPPAVARHFDLVNTPYMPDFCARVQARRQAFPDRKLFLDRILEAGDVQVETGERTDLAGLPASYTNAQRLICRIGVPLVDSGFITAAAQRCRCVLATSGSAGRAVLLSAQGLRPCTADTSRRTGRNDGGRGRRESVEGGGLCGGAVPARALGRLLRGLLVSGQRGMGCESYRLLSVPDPSSLSNTSPILCSAISTFYPKSCRPSQPAPHHPLTHLASSADCSCTRSTSRSLKTRFSCSSSRSHRLGRSRRRLHSFETWATTNFGRSCGNGSGPGHLASHHSQLDPDKSVRKKTSCVS